MKNGLFFGVGVLGIFITNVAAAQIIDVMSNIALQGQMAAQGAGQVKTALGMLKQNEIINQINLMVADIKMNPTGQYNHLNKNQYQYNLSPLDWNIGPHGSNQFFVELKNVDLSSCSKFINSFSNAQFILVNGIQTRKCNTSNAIKFIFD